MPAGKLENIAVRAIACAVPTKIIQTSEYNEQFGKEAVESFIKMTGVEQRHVANNEQTSSDLAFVAAEAALEKTGWERNTIDAIVFVTQTPDYRAPATACVLHKRLKLKEDCIAFDVNLGCSGYVYGLFICATMMQAPDIQRVILLVGDTSNRDIAPADRSAVMLFGDAGSATLLENKIESEISYILKTNGEGFKMIITPAGAYRNFGAPKLDRMCEDGIIRSDYNFFMNGNDVFSFTISDVPKTLNEFINLINLDINEIDAFIFHQANLFILKHIAKKVKIPWEKVPISIDRYGNTSVTSIPLTISDTYNGKSGKLRLILCGFGIGLSWGCLSIEVDAQNILPVIETDDYFTEGGAPD